MLQLISFHYNKKGRVPAPFFNSNFATTTKKQLLFHFSRPFITYLTVMFHHFMEQVKPKRKKLEI